MSCDLTLQGQIVIGGNGCGCSGGGVTKVQQLGLACSASYQAIESTDCPRTIDSSTEFVPLATTEEISLLFVQVTNRMTLQWGGSFAQIVGNQVLGGVVLASPEPFQFIVHSQEGEEITVNVTFDAGTYTLKQLRDIINAAAVAAGAAYFPASLTTDGTRLTLVDGKKGLAIEVSIPLTSIGFPDIATSEGEASTEVNIKGSFISQFDPPIQDLKIKGSGQVSFLAAGA